MEDLFLFDYATPIVLFLRFLVIVGIVALLVWLLNTLIMHFLFKKGTDTFTLTWKFTFLKSLIAFVFFYSTYIFFLIKINGLHWFEWSQFPLSLVNIYFLLAPEILVLIGVIALFYYQKSQINKLIK